jgi:hypothetical protein
MKTNYSGKTIGGYVLAFFLLFGILTVASSSAQAQYPWGYDRDRRDDRYRRDRDWDYRNRENVQVARQQGYSYGMNVGAADAQRGQSYNPQRSHYYRNATRGYDSAYNQVFRQAFVQGYRDGYQRYAYNNRRYGRNGRWPW